MRLLSRKGTGSVVVSAMAVVAAIGVGCFAPTGQGHAATGNDALPTCDVRVSPTPREAPATLVLATPQQLVGDVYADKQSTAAIVTSSGRTLCAALVIGRVRVATSPDADSRMTYSLLLNGLRVA